MSEIKPEHVTKELREAIVNFLGYYPTNYELSEIVNYFARHGFTVLKPGELYWFDYDPECDWIARGKGFYKIMHVKKSNDYVARAEVNNRVRYENLPTLEAAKDYCQQLENEARST